MAEAGDFFEREFAWLAELPAGARSPAAVAVDPAGEWIQGWAIWELAPERRRRVVERAGSVVLRRMPLGAGRFRLAVRLWQEMLFDVVQAVEAGVRCRLDATASPVEWWVRTEVRKLDPYRSPDPLFGLEGAGRREGTTLTLSRGGADRQVPTAGDLTFDWGLFEAVPRLAGGLPAFSEICDFATLRVGQELRPLGRVDGPAGPLDGFVQVGPGEATASFWRGADRRLCYVRRGYRAFTWEPGVWESSRP